MKSRPRLKSDAVDRLQLFLNATDDDSAIHVALRALVFHMLEHVAPKFYATRGLKPLHEATLEACANVGFAFDSEDPDVLQAGIDAWYLRTLRGLPHPKPDPTQLRAVLERLNAGGDAIYSWVLGELAARSGVDVRLPNVARTAFEASQLIRAYCLTHLVMLDSDYFARPASHADVDGWSDELASLIPWLTRVPNPDLAGEVAVCLRFLKRPEASKAKALIESVEPGDDTHELAAVLVGLTCE